MGSIFWVRFCGDWGGVRCACYLLGKFESFPRILQKSLVGEGIEFVLDCFSFRKNLFPTYVFFQTWIIFVIGFFDFLFCCLKCFLSCRFVCVNFLL